MVFFQPIFEALIFVLAAIVCFYLPGKFLITKLKLTLTFFEDIFFSSSVGILIFTLIAYICSWVSLEILLLPIFLLINFFAIKSKIWLPGKIDKKHRVSIFLVCTLTLIFSFPMVGKGVYGSTLVYGSDDL